MAEKRKAGRPPKGASGPAKKTRLSSQVKLETPEKEPTPQTPAEEEEVKPALLPNKISDRRPLPTLPSVQATDLANDEYQSIESSAVLASSLERTRQRWASGDFFERYWFKTSGRKDAPKAVPAGNPLKQWMKLLGPCTIIIEPMIFEALFYISHEPELTQATKEKNAGYQSQQQHNTASPYGAPYSAQGAPQTSYAATGRPQPPPPYTNGRPHQPVASTQQAPAPASAPPPKQSPDPVIQLLASRAATDSNLKELMKIVATGSATPEQLKTFQGHIDELNAIVAAQNPPPAPAAPATIPQAPPPAPKPSHLPIKQRAVTTPRYPLVFELINVSGATGDRFRFPQHSIIESLGQHSMLASFLVFGKGKEAADPSLYDPNTEYFEPITVKIDFPMGSKLQDDIKKSVLPAAEVRTWMEDQIRAKKRAPIRYLPLRLPHKSQLTESEEESEPLPLPVEVKKRPYKRKSEKEEAASPAPPPPPPAPVAAPAPLPVNSTTEGLRRTSRRSTRMSDAIAT
ncbi:hypothetical protein BDZ85DRAFT_261189 [Elsinoe ampelina]|uniref:SWR1-complex protein 3 domain-containing protein n=1 Tax=Elsinoe ampelina TaxID=302913 RepID=A0A6A6GFS5_9PEZI|nr:hypothetical protein BDZ85DRAFT_261189 [Elsinoe ampelina]